MLSLKCNDVIGNPIELYFAKEKYAEGNGTAFLTIDPVDMLDGDNGIYTVLSTNLPDNPIAAKWCKEPGHFVLDANNNSRELVDQLVGSGIVSLEGQSVASGFCTYPLASIPESMLNEIPDYSRIYPELAKAGVLDKVAETLEDWDEPCSAMAFEEKDSSVNVYYLSGTDTVRWARNYPMDETEKAADAFAALALEGADPERDGWPEGIPVGSGDAQDRFALDDADWLEHCVACSSRIGKAEDMICDGPFNDAGKAFEAAFTSKYKGMEAHGFDEKDIGRDSIDIREPEER